MRMSQRVAKASVFACSLARNSRALQPAESPVREADGLQACSALKALPGSHFNTELAKECLFITKRGEKELSSKSSEPDDGQSSLEWLLLRNGGTIQDFHEVSSTETKVQGQIAPCFTTLRIFAHTARQRYRKSTMKPMQAINL